MITKKLKNQLLIIVLNAAEFRLYEQKPEQFFDIYEIIMKLLGWTYGLLLILNLMFTVEIPQFGIMSGVYYASGK